MISVIVPFKNEAPHLRACIHALINQTLPSSQYELIFINNFSQDNSAKIVRSYPNVHYLETPHPLDHQFSARNLGLQIARGEIIAFTDADCVVHSSWLETIQNSLSKNKNDIVFGKRFFSKQVSFPLKYFETYENEKMNFSLSQNKSFFYAYTNNMAVRKEIFRQVGFFDTTEPFGRDTEWLHRVIREVADIKIFFSSKMWLTHLEVTSLWGWLAKLYRYGVSSSLIRKKTIYRPLSFLQKWKIFKKVLDEMNLVGLERLSCASHLFIGNCYFLLGKLTKKYSL